ncbi:hypothetical protein TorRG33x02_322470, partial [Trema orientale]
HLTMEGCRKTLKFAIRNCHQTSTPKLSDSPFPCGASMAKHGAGINSLICQLPEEVVEEILLRLPADSLKNCKRVCKWWFGLINDPSFVNRHFLRLTSEGDSAKLSRTIFLKWIRQELSLTDIFNPNYNHYWHADDPSKLVLSLLTISEEDDGKGDHVPCVVEQINLPPFPVVEQRAFPANFKALHCNGVIHMYDREIDWIAVLLNPALREFKLLQEPCLPLSSSFDKFIGCGFGYDPKANVHKYVKIFGSWSFEDPAAIVHTLGTNSWREIKIDVEENHCFLDPRGVYCNGAYYWRNISKVGNMILSFDMSEEKFHSISYPDHRLQKINLTVLDAWNESIVLFFFPKRSWFSSSFEMWVMVDSFGGVEGSTYWIKHLEIGPLRRVDYPLAFWKDDELLLETNDGRIVSYNLCTQKLRKVHLPGAVYPGFTSATLCLKSLVTV